MCGSRRVNVLRAPQCSERLVEIMFVSLGSRGLPGTTMSSNLKCTWPGISLWANHHVSLQQQPQQWKKKAAPHSSLYKNLILPRTTSFSSKINEHCHCSAHSLVAAPLKEVLASQTDPWASVSPPKMIQQRHCTLLDRQRKIRTFK